MTREELNRMRDEVLRAVAATEASTERLTLMLRENAEDMARHAEMLRMIDAELKRLPQRERGV